KCPATAKTTRFPIPPKINNRPTIALSPSFLSEISWTTGAGNCLLSVAKYLKSPSKVPSKVWSTCNRKPCGSPKRLSCWRSCWAGRPLTELDHRREIDRRSSALPDGIKCRRFLRLSSTLFVGVSGQSHADGQKLDDCK